MRQLFFIILVFITTRISTFGQDSLLEKGNFYLNNEKYNKAEQTFRDAINSDPKNLIYQCQLGLTYIEEKKFSNAEKILNNVLKVDSNNIAAIWYSGIGYYQNGKDKQTIIKFEKALTLLDKESGQYYSANWFIGNSYSNLLKTDGLTFTETDRMFKCYDEYLRLQPNAEDAPKIKEYVERKKKRRPPSNVKIWVYL